MRICFGWYADTAVSQAKTSTPMRLSHLDVPRFGREEGFAENRGFIVVGEAIHQMFHHDRAKSAYVDIRRSGNAAVSPEVIAADVNRRFDVLVLGMSYEIAPETDCSYTVEVLKSIEIPVVVLGLSVVDEALSLSSLHPSVVELLRYLDANASIFGVRAQRTQRWLATHGFENAEPLGCPSLHKQFHSSPRISYERQKNVPISIATGGYLLRDKDRGRLLCEVFAGEAATYILQEDIYDIADGTHLESEQRSGSVEYDVEYIAGMAKEIHGIEAPFVKYHLFNDMPSWRECLARHALYIGDRFHGAVAAIQAGLPAVVICKDVRSLELCDFYDIPFLSLEHAAQLRANAIIDGFIRPDVGARMRDTIAFRHEVLSDRLRSVGLSLLANIE